MVSSLDRVIPILQYSSTVYSTINERQIDRSKLFLLSPVLRLSRVIITNVYKRFYNFFFTKKCVYKRFFIYFSTFITSVPVAIVSHHQLVACLPSAVSATKKHTNKPLGEIARLNRTPCWLICLPQQVPRLDRSTSGTMRCHTACRCRCHSNPVHVNARLTSRRMTVFYCPQM